MIAWLGRWWPPLAFAVASYVAVVVASGLGWNPFDGQWDFRNTGAFGDSLAPLSTAIALVAAIGAVAAYRAQREELDRVKEAAPIERAEAAKRDFETTFFNLLELLRETVNEIDVTDAYGKNAVTGRDALRRILDEFISPLRPKLGSNREAFRKSYFRFRDDLAHYFRLFYHILKYIHESSVDDKMLYVRLLRATLSDAEIVLIALNCLYGGGQEKLKPLVEKYAVLHNISAQSRKTWNLEDGFEYPAYGDRTFKDDEEIV